LKHILAGFSNNHDLIDLDADESFQKKLESGHRMQKPPFAPDEM
jgi:hypothetical protein